MTTPDEVIRGNMYQHVSQATIATVLRIDTTDENGELPDPSVTVRVMGEVYEVPMSYFCLKYKTISIPEL